jgi:hypothetical protein
MFARCVPVGGFCGDSNVVRVNVTDECGWIGVRGPPPSPRDVPVLAAAPQPCNGVVVAPTELRSPGGGSFALTSGIAEWISIWKQRGDKIANVELELGLTRQAGPVRVRLRAGTPLSRHVIPGADGSRARRPARAIRRGDLPSTAPHARARPPRPSSARAGAVPLSVEQVSSSDVRSHALSRPAADAVPCASQNPAGVRHAE